MNKVKLLVLKNALDSYEKHVLRMKRRAVQAQRDYEKSQLELAYYATEYKHALLDAMEEGYENPYAV